MVLLLSGHCVGSLHWQTLPGLCNVGSPQQAPGAAPTLRILPLLWGHLGLLLCGGGVVTAAVHCQWPLQSKGLRSWLDGS